jgi:MFS family permease
MIERLRMERWSLWVQMTVTFLAITTMAGTRPTATYRTLSLGGSAFDVGVIQSAYSILPALTAVLIGRWVDRFGEVLIYSGAMVVLGLGSVISAMADSLAILGIGQALIGFGTIAMLIASQAMIANRTTPDAWNRNYGTYAAFLSLGQLVGPVVAATVLSTPEAGPVPERAAFTIFAAATFAGALLILVVPRERPKRETAEGAGTGRFLDVVVRIVRRPGMLAAMFVSIVVLSAIDILIAYLPVLGEAKALPVALVGLLLSVRAATTLVSRLFMDRLLKRFGWVPVLAGSLGIAAGALIFLPLTTAPWLLAGLMGIVGLGIGFGQPMAVTFVASRATKQDRATALAVRLSANRISLLFVPAVMGAVAGAAGVDIVFWILAGILAAGSVVAASAKLEASAGEAREEGVKAEATAGERT